MLHRRHEPTGPGRGDTVQILPLVLRQEVEQVLRILGREVNKEKITGF